MHLPLCMPLDCGGWGVLRYRHGHPNASCRLFLTKILASVWARACIFGRKRRRFSWSLGFICNWRRMKVKVRQRGAREFSVKSEPTEHSGKKPHQKHNNDDNQENSSTSECGDGTTRKSTTEPSTSRPICVSAPAPSVGSAASRPPLVIGTTSATTSVTPPTRALTQQQLRRQRQLQRTVVPPIRARGCQARGAAAPAATNNTSRSHRNGWTATAAASTAAAATAAVGGNSANSGNSPAAFAEVVRAVERALEDGSDGQKRLMALSVEQPDLYSQVILALFRETQNLELISRMPMPMIPEPDFFMEPPMPGADFDFDRGWDEGEDGEDFDYWDALGGVAGPFNGGEYDMYDMPYDLDGFDPPFPEPPIPSLDYDPELDDDDLYDDDDSEWEEEEFGYVDKVGVIGAGGGFEGFRRASYWDDGVEEVRHVKERKEAEIVSDDGDDKPGDALRAQLPDASYETSVYGGGAGSLSAELQGLQLNGNPHPVVLT